ncbi:MAG: hybrid sensor histidine kinase/response regulator [Syntrophorhabdaceae bacterium]
MKVSGFFPKRFGSRLFLMTIVAGFIPIAIFSILINVFGNRFESSVRQTISQGYNEEWEKSSALLTRMGETAIRQKAYDIAAQLDLTLQSHPYMTLGDLKRDKEFRRVAVQEIGEKGYTGVHETQKGVIRFHRDRNVEGMTTRKLAQKLPEYAKILEENRRGKAVGGYFDWIEADGTVSKKYMYVVPLSVPTADGTSLSVFVTTYLDEFTKPMREAYSIQQQTAGNVASTMSNLIASFRNQGLLFMGLGIFLVSLAALAIGMYFSRGISRLSEATRAVHNGDFDVRVKPILSGEIRALMEDFNYMAARLKDTTVSKELLEESEKKLREMNGELRREINIRSIAEKALAAEKERLAVTLLSIGDGVITTDVTGRIILINRAAEELTGYPQIEVEGRSLSEILIIRENAWPNDTSIESLIDTSREAAFSGPCTLVSRDGTERHISKNLSPIRNDQNTLVGAVLVLRDITEQQRMESELLRARKLESIGTLAGGIAHDFNNLLAVILGNISFAKMLIKTDIKAMKRLDEAEKATIRGKDLSYRLLTFARGGAPVKRITAIYDLIYDAAEITVSGSNVKCEYGFSETLFKAFIDEGQIRQVIHNIVLNARESMPEGGVVFVSAENILLEHDDRGLHAGNYIQISVQDSGNGILPENLDRVFDPYFTTKEMGSEKGMGLGLAICYSIIKNHNGHITIMSQPDKGTTVHVYLQAYDAAIPVILETDPPGAARILYMDDEPQVRDVAGQILRHMGYSVEFARDGIEAIDLFKKGAATGVPYDLVVLDLTVPGGMGGREAIECLRAINPKIKAIVSSGYVDNAMLHDYAKYGFSGVVAKPYSVEQFEKVICQVLNASC